MKTKRLNELQFQPPYILTHLAVLSINHAAPIDTFPLILTQGANKLTSDAQPARATAIKNTALNPSM
jgi:hypothetical protein